MLEARTRRRTIGVFRCTLHDARRRRDAMNEHSRRDFFKLAAALGGTAGAAGLLPRSIQRALAIDPAPGSTYLDAEHVVILMQENRSLDHAYGTLQGVRGFNDPRAITLPDGNPVWVQTSDAGESYAPFRFDIKNDKSTWMGCLPHGWTDQVDARNHGRYDRWLDNKRSGDDAYAAMPLTMGYYTREDLPFYYELADAFTICDQNFCSTLTGTTPNRLHLWTGTIRPEQKPESKAHVLNSDCEYGAWCNWPSFPDRLEDHGVSWKIYQNEITMPSGLTTDQDAWLANFGDSPLEWFTQFNVQLASGRRRYVERLAQELPREIAELEKTRLRSDLSPRRAARLARRYVEAKAQLAAIEEERRKYPADGFAKLPERSRNLHAKAFTVNDGDPHYRELAEIAYRDGGEERRLVAPKGDVFHQFRKDVEAGQLPAVSWLVAPEKFSDHPCSAWYGAWYIAEALDILTQNPEVWRKTIFILTYDENDGYFDHVPPFVSPHPNKPETGRVSAGVDAALEFVEGEHELTGKPVAECRDSPMGLGYRVPLVIASPWSRGGCVCSQVFDHTSSLLFLEKWLSHKAGRPLVEPNINTWRRTVCGDLTSAFQTPDDGEARVAVPARDAFLAQIHQAQYKPLPGGFQKLSPDQLQQIRRDGHRTGLLPEQEPGIRRACSLPYELAAEGKLSDDRSEFVIALAARNQAFGERAAGSPFTVYANPGATDMHVRNYAVAAGDRLEDSWRIADFTSGRYHLAVYGPNGFFREFRGDKGDPLAMIELEPCRTPEARRPFDGDIELRLFNGHPQHSLAVEIRDCSYGARVIVRTLAPGEAAMCRVDSRRSFGWYDLEVRVAGYEHFAKRYAGRVETGVPSYTDPAMGRVTV
jgi:phospholipase C